MLRTGGIRHHTKAPRRAASSTGGEGGMRWPMPQDESTRHSGSALEVLGASPKVSMQTAPRTASGPIAQLKPKPNPMANQRLPPTTRANEGAREPQVSLGEDATSHTPHPIAPQGEIYIYIYIYIDI